MSKPTKKQMLDTRERVIKALAILNRTLPFDAVSVQAMVEVETFCAVAMRVFSKTNTSKLQSETTTVELAARLSGRVVFDPD